jgi:hypothetical protein
VSVARRPAERRADRCASCGDGLLARCGDPASAVWRAAVEVHDCLRSAPRCRATPWRAPPRGRAARRFRRRRPGLQIATDELGGEDRGAVCEAGSVRSRNYAPDRTSPGRLSSPESRSTPLSTAALGSPPYRTAAIPPTIAKPPDGARG